MSIFTGRRKGLYIPGSTATQLRGPDPRAMIATVPDSRPLPGEIDYDDLEIVSSWKEFDPQEPDSVKYMCYHIRQRLPHQSDTIEFYKAIRFIRLTRVPRYLKSAGAASGPGVFTQMRDVLVALREKNVLFCHLITKSPTLPLIFAYGVQATGATIDEAQLLTDDAYAALSVNLDGTYQQLEYKPLSAHEAQSITDYQSQWTHIAVARGRPVPQGASLGSSSMFDGNRTDVENTNNQLESFIRGMSDKSFMLSMVTVPMSAADLTLAWKNLADTTTKIKSEIRSTRGMAAGIALPLGMGAGLSHTGTDSHGLTSTDTLGGSTSHQVSTSDGTAHTLTDTHSTGTSQTTTSGLSHSDGSSSTDTGTHTVTAGTSATDTTGHTATAGTSEGTSSSHGTSATDTTGHTDTTGSNSSVAVGQNVSQASGVTTNQSVASGSTASANWAEQSGHSASTGHTLTSGSSASDGHSTSSGYSTGVSTGGGVSQGGSVSSGGGVNGGIPFLSGGQNTSTGYNSGDNQTVGNSAGHYQSGADSSQVGHSQSAANSSQYASQYSASQGGSMANSVTNTASVGQSNTVTTANSLSHTDGISASQAVSASRATGLSDSMGSTHSTNASDAASTSRAAGQSSATAAGSSHAAGTSTSNGTSSSTAAGSSAGTSNSEATSVSSQNGVSSGTATNSSQALADGWSAAMARQASQTASLGIVPTFTATVTHQHEDEAKRILADMLEAQVMRYVDGIEGGAFLYQMFLTTPDRETLVGAAALLKSAFWGGGSYNRRLTAPFHTTLIDSDPQEAARLLAHARAFSQYRRREPVAGLVEPHLYSTFVTTGEASCFCHPPVAEAPGIQTQTDSMPVLAMPSDREHKEIYLGHVVNGERGRESNIRFGVDVDELSHVLIQGVTGMGKTTTMLRLLEQLSKVQRQAPKDPLRPSPSSDRLAGPLRAGAVVLDWMCSARNLASVIEPARFRLYSVSNPKIGAFRFNPLQIPDTTMDPVEWSAAVADNLAVSFGLGDVGRSILAEILDTLYTADRLTDFVLRPAVIDEQTGAIIRPAIILPKVNRADLPADAIRTDSTGTEYANVYTCAQLSRLVGLPDMAVLVAVMQEEAATVDGARKQGIDQRNRINSVWRRIQQYAPGHHMASMLAADPDWNTPVCLTVKDIIDPDAGLFTVIETDGLSFEARRVIVGSVMLAIYRYGMHNGAGCFNHNGAGPGTYLVLEEAHEILGSGGTEETTDSAKMRTNLYTSMFRRIRSTGMRLIAVTQNCSQIPSGVVGQTTTLFAHHTSDTADRNALFGLLNWLNTIGQQQREFRYLGEMPAGWAVVRLKAQTSYLQSAPIQVVIDPVPLDTVTDDDLEILAAARNRTHT